MTSFQTCDHPRLLVQDNRCLLCQELDGQTDALEEITT